MSFSWSDNRTILIEFRSSKSFSLSFPFFLLLSSWSLAYFAKREGWRESRVCVYIYVCISSPFPRVHRLIGESFHWKEIKEKIGFPVGRWILKVSLLFLSPPRLWRQRFDGRRGGNKQANLIFLFRHLGKGKGRGWKGGGGRDDTTRDGTTRSRNYRPTNISDAKSRRNFRSLSIGINFHKFSFDK